MVGMRDVAKKAGVSLSTVSLVVNGNGYVSDDMRDRVRKAMQASIMCRTSLPAICIMIARIWSASSCLPFVIRSLQR